MNAAQILRAALLQLSVEMFYGCPISTSEFEPGEAEHWLYVIARGDGTLSAQLDETGSVTLVLV